MADAQNIVDQIRAFLAANDQTNSPQLAELAGDYAALCAAANARLSKCADYLRKGLRSEAIQLAEDAPILLDLVSALDIPEAQDWAGICTMYSLTRPPALLMDAAQMLNEAYGIEQPMQVLLNRHRRFALELAPLTERIKVLRDLARADTTSPVWPEDVRTFETARLREVKIEATAAIKARNRQTLSVLLAEVNSPGWSVEIPAEIRTAIQSFESAFAAEQALSQVRKLALELDGAYGAMDLAGSKKLLAQIKTIATEQKLTLPPEVLEQVEPAERWVAQQRAKAAARMQMEAALGALNTALDENQPASEVQRLKADAVALGATVTEETQARIQQLAAQQEAQRRRANALRLVAAAAVVVILAAVSISAQRIYSRNQTARAAAVKLHQELDANDLDAATAELASLKSQSPFVLDRPEVRSETDRLATMTRAQAADRDNFKSADEIAKAAIEAANESATKTASASDAIWSPAKQAVEQVRAAAKNDADRHEADLLEVLVNSDITAIENHNRERNQKRLADLQGSAAELISQSGSLTEDDPRLTGLIKSAGELRDSLSSHDASDPVYAGAGEVLDHLRSIQSRLARGNREKMALERLKDSATSAKLLADALNDYCVELPGTERGNHFAEAVKNANVWTAAEQAETLIVKWNMAARPPAGSLEARISDITQYLGEYSTSPFAANLKSYQSYLLAAEAGVGSQGYWAKEFVAYFEQQPLFSDTLQCIRSNGSSAACYFLPSAESATHSVINGTDFGWNFKYITSSDTSGQGGSLKPGKLKITDVKDPPGPTPQCTLLKKLRASVASRDDGVQLGFELMDSIAGAEDVDPILRVIMLHQALTTGGAKVPWDGSIRLTDLATDLEKMNMDLAWMNPDDHEAMSKRPVALDQLKDAQKLLTKTAQRIQDHFNRIVKTFEPRIIARGVLLMDSGSGWSISLPASQGAVKIAEGTHAFIATGDDWVSVAAYHNGKFEIDTRAVNPNLDGSMVFVRTNSD